MGLQVPCSVDTEVQKEDNLWRDQETVRTGVEGIGKTEGKPDTGRATPEGPHTHAHRDPSQVCGRPGDRVHQRKECNIDCPHQWPQKELHRSKLLGSGLFRVHGGNG
jgi:hypothetical protein